MIRYLGMITAIFILDYLRRSGMSVSEVIMIWLALGVIYGCARNE